MGITTSSLNSLNIFNHILLVTTVLLSRWQHQMDSNGRDWHMVETESIDSVFGCWRWQPTCIHEHLLKMYGEATVDLSTVWQWVGRVKEDETGEAALYGKLWSGHPCTAVNGSHLQDWWDDTWQLSHTNRWIMLHPIHWQGSTEQLLDSYAIPGPWSMGALLTDVCTQRDTESKYQAPLAPYDTGSEARASLCKFLHGVKPCSTFFLNSNPSRNQWKGAIWLPQ